VEDTVELVGEILEAALDHIGTPNTMRALSRVLSEHYGSCGAMLFGLKTDGNLEFVEGFGFPPIFENELRSVSLFDSWPLTESIREGKIIRTSVTEALEKYPRFSELNSPPAVGYMVPCYSSGSPMGGLIVAFFAAEDLGQVPSAVLQAMQVASYHVLSRQLGLVEVP